MATIDEIKKTTQSFANNFENDGFVVFDNKCKTAFEGRVLVDYKGLRVVRMRKSQEQEDNIPEADLKEATLEALKSGDKNNPDPTHILQHLKQRFDKCIGCVLTGKDFHSDSVGEIVKLSVR